MSDSLIQTVMERIGNDEERFKELFIEYYPSLYAFALHYVEDKVVVEDLVQEVFIKIWETRIRLRNVTDFSGYIYQMLRFKCFNYLRGQKVRDHAALQFIEEQDVTQLNIFIQEETVRLVKTALSELPPACREVMTLTLEGYKAKDIAQELNIATETVKKHKQNARRLLKVKLGRLLLFL